MGNLKEMKVRLSQIEVDLSAENKDYRTIPRWSVMECLLELNCQPYTTYQRVTKKPTVLKENKGIIDHRVSYQDSIPERFQDLDISAERYFLLEKEKREHL